MNLVIDIGNTRIKYGVFNKNTLVAEGVISDHLIDPVLVQYEITNSIVCSVAEQPEELKKKLNANTNYIDFSSETSAPIKNLYKSKQTLGSDRLAAAIGAHLQFPEKNVLAIDTGTCIKYNFITAKGEYIGGAISPGIEMRFKALNHFTQRLPIVEANYDLNILIGNNTQDSILSGVMNGALKEVEGTIAEYNKQYPGITTVITGGNHAYFVKRLKSSIFADPFLLLKGLNAIIEYNVRK
jgi:type III pantothenate kinase